MYFWKQLRQCIYEFLESFEWVPASRSNVLQTKVFWMFHELLCGLLRFRVPPPRCPCRRTWWDLLPIAGEGLCKQHSTLLHCSCWPLLATFFGKVSMVLSLPAIFHASFWKLLFQRGFFWQHVDLYANKRTACSFETEEGLLRHSLFCLKKYQVCSNDFHEEGSATSA